MTQNSDTAFTDEQYAIMFPTGSGDHYWNITKKTVVESALKKISPKGVLDIGAGVGIVTSHLKERGFQVWGTELAPVRVPEDLRDILFTGKNLSELPAEVMEQVDTILLLDVIEHLPDPRLLIKEALTFLPHLRHVVITVPARMELWSNLDEFNHHFIRYDRPGLIRLMNEAGWETAYCGYYFHALYWPALLVAKLGLNRSVVLYGPTGLARHIHRLISKILRLDYQILPRFLVGSSVIGVFSRKT
jgi:SAM-dependent methyltransferase